MFSWYSYQTLKSNEKIFSELINLTKKWLQVLIIKTFSLVFLKNVITRLKQNIIYISINVCRYENKQAYPIYLSKETLENHMELLLTENGGKWHYNYIKDMYNKVKYKNKKYFCMDCLQCFSSLFRNKWETNYRNA